MMTSVMGTSARIRGSVLAAAALLGGLVTAAPAAARADTDAAAAWHNLQHGSVMASTPEGGGAYWTKAVNRPKGVRIMQVKARCWGNDSGLDVDLQYKGRLGWKRAKHAKGTCNGNYVYARVSNAGNSKYRAAFGLDRMHTVEWWVQYYK